MRIKPPYTQYEGMWANISGYMDTFYIVKFLEKTVSLGLDVVVYLAAMVPWDRRVASFGKKYLQLGGSSKFYVGDKIDVLKTVGADMSSGQRKVVKSVFRQWKG
jgi:hypothetical protein